MNQPTNQAVQEEFSDADLTRIYNEANGINGGKNPPITTERIFAAMRACLRRSQPEQPQHVPHDVLREMVNSNPFVSPSSSFAIRLAEDVANWLHENALRLSGAPLTDSYVQEVPDKCDRIVWRGHYHHLPLAQANSRDFVLYGYVSGEFGLHIHTDNRHIKDPHPVYVPAPAFTNRAEPVKDKA